jgi:hypothetical protein
MTRRKLCIICACALLPAVALADEPAGDTFVVRDGDRTVAVTIEGGELTVITDGDGGRTVRIVDLEQVGLLAEDALAQALAAVKDLQLDVHMGADNRLEFSGGERTWEVDVNAIAAEVSRALQAGLGDLDTAGWHGVHERDRTEAELRAELEILKAELMRLRGELESRGDI